MPFRLFYRLNGMDPGQISDSYPNLFAPAGLTFSIWSVIYIWLLIFILYQLGAFGKKDGFNASQPDWQLVCHFIAGERRLDIFLALSRHSAVLGIDGGHIS